MPAVNRGEHKLLQTPVVTPQSGQVNAAKGSPSWTVTIFRDILTLSLARVHGRFGVVNFFHLQFLSVRQKNKSGINRQKEMKMFP
jgi:hypothetical protein